MVVMLTIGHGGLNMLDLMQGACGGRRKKCASAAQQKEQAQGLSQDTHGPLILYHIERGNYGLGQPIPSPASPRTPR